MHPDAILLVCRAKGDGGDNCACLCAGIGANMDSASAEAVYV
jgi:hypothetical protein